MLKIEDYLWKGVWVICYLFSSISAQDPDPTDPQHFGLLDPDPDSQKICGSSNPETRSKYQPKTAKLKRYDQKWPCL